jgi:3-phosphoshikimate 1-carboxyvinyltransferase
MSFIDLPAARRATGSVRLPGSKSISNRLLLLAAMARGTTELAGLLQADDTRVMLDALRALGVAVDASSAGRDLDAGPDIPGVRIRGTGGGFPAKAADIFLGNAGTAFRPLTAALALSSGEYRLHGVPRMHERPIRDLVDALRGIGARIDYEAADGFPPLRIHPGSVTLAQPVRVRGDVSSQFLTALLLALPLAGGGRIEVEGELISKPYIAITLRSMQRFGVHVRHENWKSFAVPGGPYTAPARLLVEGDASAASYFLAAGAIGGGPVSVEGVGADSMQGDVRFTEVLERMGAAVSTTGASIACAGHAPLRPIDMDLNHIPDAAMTAAVLALFAGGTSTLRNIASWRVKETDRLFAMATELRKLGADVEEGADYLRVTPRELTRSVAIDTYDDHRIAMSFSLVSLGGVAVRINDPQCVAKTFPGYFDAFRSIVQ